MRAFAGCVVTLLAISVACQARFALADDYYSISGIDHFD